MLHTLGFMLLCYFVFYCCLFTTVLLDCTHMFYGVPVFFHSPVMSFNLLFHYLLPCRLKEAAGNLAGRLLSGRSNTEKEQKVGFLQSSIN